MPDTAMLPLASMDMDERRSNRSHIPMPAEYRLFIGPSIGSEKTVSVAKCSAFGEALGKPNTRWKHEGGTTQEVPQRATTSKERILTEFLYSLRPFGKEELQRP